MYVYKGVAIFCSPVLAQHIARADTRLHATPWPLAQVVLRVEAADMV
jgi:hypothetical protein